MSTPNELAQILPKSVQTRRRIEAAVEVVFEQEVHGADMRHFAAVDGVAGVFFREQRDENFRREQAAQPVPFVVVAHEEPDVGVACL